MLFRRRESKRRRCLGGCDVEEGKREGIKGGNELSVFRFSALFQFLLLFLLLQMYLHYCTVQAVLLEGEVDCRRQFRRSFDAFYSHTLNGSHFGTRLPPFFPNAFYFSQMLSNAVQMLCKYRLLGHWKFFNRTQQFAGFKK